MKSLISVFTYCPDFKRKKILHELLDSLQAKRDKFDLMVVSHSPISDLSLEMIDYFYFDRENTLLKDFDLTNKFWFRSGPLVVNSSLVYPYSTHLSIYRLLYYTLNFSKFKGYEKTHFIEYDIKMDDVNLLNHVDKKLDEYDNVMFKDDAGWAWGVYFASKIKSFSDLDLKYDEEKILNDLRMVENRMTENVTPKILSAGERSIFYENISLIDKKEICQKNDEHLNDTLKWCVPIVDESGNGLSFFIFNEKGGKYNVDVFVNEMCRSFITEKTGVWTLDTLAKFDEVTKVEVFVDKKLRSSIIFNEENREKFKKNNFYKYS